VNLDIERIPLVGRKNQPATIEILNNYSSGVATMNAGCPDLDELTCGSHIPTADNRLLSV